MRLRTNLFLLVGGAVAPLVIVTLVLSWILVAEFQETVHRSAVDRNRAFMSAVDAELRGHVTTLQAIAASSSLQRGELDAFGDELRLALASQPTWLTVYLSDSSGLPVANHHGSLDLALTTEPDSASEKRAFDSAQPAFGNVARWTASGRGGVAIRWPVRIQGRVQYVLTAVVDVQQFQHLIVAQKLPMGWRSGVVDGVGRFVARVPRPPREAVDKASPDFLAAVQRSQEGWYRGRTVEGEDTYTAHVTSEVSGWSLGLAIPTALVLGPAMRATWGIAAALLLTLAVALAFSYLLSKRIASPMRQLADQASGERSLAPVRTDIVEIEAMAKVLQNARAAAEEREDLLKREHAALIEADRSKDEFLAMLGHELRNPLSAISTSAHVLRVQSAGAAHDRAIAILTRQTRQMTKLVDDLLDISRLTMGKVVLAVEAFDLHALASSVIAALLAAGRVMPEQIKLSGDSVWLKGDRGRIEQVISNLIDNAAKFGGRDSAIELRTRVESESVVMEVLDRGPGIPTGAERRIFDRFEQGPQGLDRAVGGLGLGLAIVRQLVTLHGGEVEAHNREDGPGACFTLRFPRLPALESTLEAPANAASVRTLNILVVEDLADVGEVMTEFLTMEGHQVHLVSNGRDAVQRAAQNHPDVVLLDIGLPDMPGYEVARLLRANAKQDIGIIALTGYGQSADEQRAIDAGCDLHLRKPVEMSDLLGAIGRVVEARRSARE